jgi:hypothetical protein
VSTQNAALSNGDVTPLVVKPKVAWKMLACSNTRGYELLNAGELESFLDGRSRKITVESIRRYVARRVTRAPAEDMSPRRRCQPRQTLPLAEVDTP